VVDDTNPKKEDSFEFDPSGEAVAYISLEQARVLAMRTASETPGVYGTSNGGVAMFFVAVEEADGEDYYVITLSFRPQGDFSGTPGREQFFITKEGLIDHRQVQELPTDAVKERTQTSELTQTTEDTAENDSDIAIEIEPEINREEIKFIIPNGFNVADAGRRMIAHIVDLVIAMALLLTPVFIAIEAEEAGNTALDNAMMGTFFAVFIIYLIFWIYSATKGWSIGKLLFGLRIFDLKGNNIEYGTAIKREIVFKVLVIGISGGVGYLAFLWIFWNPDGLGWHDKFAKTVVLQKASPIRGRNGHQ